MAGTKRDSREVRERAEVAPVAWTPESLRQSQPVVQEFWRKMRMRVERRAATGGVEVIVPIVLARQAGAVGGRRVPLGEGEPGRLR